MNITWTESALEHYIGGITISLADRAFSEGAKRKTDQRIQRKVEEVEALEFLVDNSTDESVRDSRKYNDAVVKARNYFQKQGIKCEPRIDAHEGNISYAIRKISNGLNHFRQSHEKLNNLHWDSKLIAAFGTELVLDLGVVVTHAIYGVGNSISALSRTPIQTLALWSGLYTGRGILYVKDLFVKSKEEKELDEIGRDLTADNKLLQIVKGYAPTKDLVVEVVSVRALNSDEEQKMLPSEEDTNDSGNLGEKVGKGLVNTYEGVEDGVRSGIDVIRKRMEERNKVREDAEKLRLEELRSKYKDY